MQTAEIQKRFTNIEQFVEQASQGCKSNADIPKVLVDCVAQLDAQTTKAKQDFQSKDEARIRQSVDALEKLSDSAEREVDKVKGVNEEVKSAIKKAHTQLSELKQQLH